MNRFILVFIHLLFFACQSESQQEDDSPNDLGIVEIKENPDWYENPTWIELKEGQGYRSYYRFNDRIYIGDRNIKNKPIDATTKDFRIFAGSDYAKDKYYFFHPLEETSICNSYKKYGCVCSYEDYIIGKFNVENFQVLSTHYATNQDSIFYKGKILQEADVKSFKVQKFDNLKIMDNSFDSFATDENYVFLNETILDLDPKTFFMKYDSIQTTFVVGDQHKTYQYFFAQLLHPL